MSSNPLRIIDFESVDPTVIPPFESRPGSLIELFGGTLTRGGSRFDIMGNIGDQAKPPEFGNYSLDPFFAENDATPFKYELGNNSSERGSFFTNTVSITVGDYGVDEDTVTLQAFDAKNTLIGTDIKTLPGGGENFTSVTLTVSTVDGAQISYIQFAGGSSEYPNSVFYDNITFTYVPTEYELSQSNPYWNWNVDEVVNKLLEELFAEALNGRGSNFVYLIGEGESSKEKPPITPYAKQYRDEYTTNATESLKEGSEEWLDAIQKYLDEKYPLQGTLFRTYRESGGLSFKIFIAMIQTADSAVRISEQKGLNSYNPEVLIEAGIEPFGNLIDDAVIEGINQKYPIPIPDAAVEFIDNNIRLETYITNKLKSSNPTPQSPQKNTGVGSEALYSAEVLSVDNEAPISLEDLIIATNGIIGTESDDYLFGTTNDNILVGDEGWDVLIGGAGNDLILGGDGLDMLNGNGESFVAGEVDVLAGGEGVDIFVLGDPNRSYYNDEDLNTSGTSDYALITDFNSKHDFIVLKGKYSDYTFGINQDDTSLSIFLDDDGVVGSSPNDELIAKVAGITTISPVDIMFV
ncbi:MAG: calcium-binding protein [Scytonema sp. PMC 1069.18]|nr:calcium-binding protein [Scytonema sp. PMC 1069.18]MEC4886798.1 calcium-binding protein [Scytonema sp. PMC 1070.18]